MVKYLPTLSILSFVCAAFCVLNFFFMGYVIYVGLQAYNNPSSVPIMAGGPTPSTADIQAAAVIYIASGGCSGLLSLVGCALNVVAAGRYSSGNGRGLLLVVAALNLIPCVFGCCLIGPPIGIFSLVVLNNPVVKTYFDTVDPAEKRKLAGDQAADEGLGG